MGILFDVRGGVQDANIEKQKQNSIKSRLSKFQLDISVLSVMCTQTETLMTIEPPSKKIKHTRNRMREEEE